MIDLEVVVQSGQIKYRLGTGQIFQPSEGRKCRGQVKLQHSRRYLTCPQMDSWIIDWSIGGIGDRSDSSTRVR
jgi:hypothetical protein